MPKKSSCIGCERRSSGKCELMTKILKSRRCYVTLDEAIKIENEIIEYIDAGKHPHDDIQDRRQRTMAVNKLDKLMKSRDALMA